MQLRIEKTARVTATAVQRLLALPENLALLPITSAVVSRLSVYATLAVAARLLDGEQFGALAVCLVVTGILSALVTGGGDMWLNRFTAELASVTGQAPRLWPVYFFVVLAISTSLLTVISIMEAARVLPDLFAGLGIATAAAAVLVGMSEALLAVMRAGGAVRLFFVGRDIVAPISYLLLLIWVRPYTALDALLLYVALWGAGFVLIASRLVWRAPLMLPAIRPPSMAWFPVVRHTLGLIYGNLTSRLSIYIDVLVLTSIVSITTIGEYRVAAQFAIGFMVIQHFVFLGLPWQLRRFSALPASSVALETVIGRQRVLLLLAAAGGALMWVAAHPLLTLLGDRFGEMAPIFRILLLTRFASLLWGPQHEILVSNGFSLEDAHTNVVAIIGWFASFLLLQGAFGVLRAAVLGIILSTLAQHLLRRWYLHRCALPPIYGHSFGMAAPVAGFLATLVIAALLLPH